MVDEKAKKKIEKGIKSNGRWVIFWSIVFAIAAVVIIVSIFSQVRFDTGGEAKVTEIRALVCKSDDYFYPLLSYDESISKEFKIITTFAGDEVRSMSLQQMLYYDNNEQITMSEAENHAEMNKQFGQDGLPADALDASFAMIDNGLRVGLYSTYDRLGANSMKYFLLKETRDYDYSSIKDYYTELGLKCSDS